MVQNFDNFDNFCWHNRYPPSAGPPLSVVAAVILAAGSSKRLGQPKALLDFGGSPLVLDLVRRLDSSGLGISPIIVVVNETINGAVELVLEDTNAVVVVNNSPESGRTGSLKLGLAEMLGAEVVLVIPVDRPGWSPSTLRALVEADDCCCPSSGGKGGHPLRLKSNDIARIIAASDDTRLNRLVEPRRFEVKDQFLHLNIDTPDDLPLLAVAVSTLARTEF
jgi:CTP:molybdopterin cytidylyltransferase MocA